jgi:hypothetical protein
LYDRDSEVARLEGEVDTVWEEIEKAREDQEQLIDLIEAISVKFGGNTRPKKEEVENE